MNGFGDNHKAIWLDCDPGHDDAMAIILAGHNPSCRLLGVSTVVGNQTLDKVTENALSVLAASGLGHIDVVAGQAQPLLRPLQLCPEIHGESGLDGPAGGPILPPAPYGTAMPGPAAVIMYEKIKAAHQASGATMRVHLVATAALTNVALLLVLFPDVVEMIEIVVMGGALGIGNTGSVAEFNIQSDPHAAQIVLERAGGPHLTFVPLEVTHTALATPEILNRIRYISLDKKHRPFLTAIVDLLTFFADTYRKVFRFEHPPLHDPCAVAYVIQPELFVCEQLRVDVELASSLSLGQTVVDVWRRSKQPANANVCMRIDVNKFWDLMIEALRDAMTAVE